MLFVQLALNIYISVNWCKVSDSTGDHEVYPFHSFNDGATCADNRLNVIQTDFGPDIVFTMRTFRFIISGTENKEQQQTIVCNLHLDASENQNQNQPARCTCYTSDECQLDPEYPFGEGWKKD